MCEPCDQCRDAAPAEWIYFHMVGSREELEASLSRLGTRGWTVSHEAPIPGPFGSWDVPVLPRCGARDVNCVRPSTLEAADSRTIAAR